MHSLAFAQSDVHVVAAAVWRGRVSHRVATVPAQLRVTFTPNLGTGARRDATPCCALAALVPVRSAVKGVMQLQLTTCYQVGCLCASLSLNAHPLMREGGGASHADTFTVLDGGLSCTTYDG